MTIKLWSEFSDLVIPTRPTLHLTQDMSERFDVLRPALVEIADMTFDYVEDYSVYPEGFWFKVLSGAAEIQVLLNDGLGDAHFFWGRVIDENVDLAELDLTIGGIRRTGAFRCASNFVKIKDKTIDDLHAEASTHLETLGSAYRFISMKALVASLIKITYGLSYSINDVEIQGDDFRYRESGVAAPGGLHGFESLHMLYQHSDATTRRGYFGESLYNAFNQFLFPWSSRFADCYELMRHLMMNFGFVPRYYWNNTIERHVIQLIARGTGFATPITMSGGVKSSTFTKKSEVKARNTETNRTQTFQYTPTPGYNNSAFHCIDGLLGEGKLPPPLKADLNMTFDFNANGSAIMLGTVIGGEQLALLEEVISVFNTIEDVTYWDRSTQDFDGTQRYMGAAHALYWNKMYASPKRLYERVYNSLKANDGTTNSHVNNHVLRKVVIDDDVSARTFTSAHVKKNLVKNESYILHMEL